MWMYVYAHTFVCVYTYVCMCIHIRLYVYTHTFTILCLTPYIYIHIDTTVEVQIHMKRQLHKKITFVYAPKSSLPSKELYGRIGAKFDPREGRTVKFWREVLRSDSWSFFVPREAKPTVRWCMYVGEWMRTLMNVCMDVCILYIDYNNISMYIQT